MNIKNILLPLGFTFLLLPTLAGSVDQQVWIKSYTVSQWFVDKYLRFEKTVAGGFIVASTVYDASTSNIVVAILNKEGSIEWGKLLDLHPRFLDLAFHTYGFRDGYYSVSGLYGPYKYPYSVVMDPRGLLVKAESIPISTEGNITVVAVDSELLFFGRSGEAKRIYMAVFNKERGFVKYLEFSPQEGVDRFASVHSAIRTKRNMILLSGAGRSRTGKLDRVVLSALHTNGSVNWCRSIGLGGEVVELSLSELNDGFLILGVVNLSGGATPSILLIKVSLNGELEYVKFIHVSNLDGRYRPVSVVYDRDGDPVIIGSSLVIGGRAGIFTLKTDSSFNPKKGVLLSYVRNITLTQVLSRDGELNLLLAERDGNYSGFMIAKLMNVDQLYNTKLFESTDLEFKVVDSLNYTVEKLTLSTSEREVSSRSISVESIKAVNVLSTTVYYETPSTARSNGGLNVGKGVIPEDYIKFIMITAPIYVPLIVIIVLSIVILRRINRDLREYSQFTST